MKLRRGDFFGELALLDAAPRTATVEAESEVLTMRLGRTAFQKVLDSEQENLLASLRLSSLKAQTKNETKLHDRAASSMQ